ncbi:organic solute transporter Ostalpha-domain-containing protein [Suillus americanus]|nr:organic solute transporter Ostalpha-domain-containing protein [Suillus americanus]
MGILPDLNHGRGAGSGLPLPVLLLAGVSTLVAVTVSGLSIWLQLRNYRKPLLQRMVIRIMLMVPIYALSSLISLFSLDAAFFIDVIRDVYEAFVIYCFFVLLLDYLGGERSLLIQLHGRPPIPAIFPVSLWRHEVDVSDPYTFLFIKRGILQYVQVKPVLAVASLIMKATGTYHEGDFRARSGYLYVSIVYNVSICLALYCLAVFWMCVSDDLKPFRPVPKFLCVKGILFFSFWQSIAVSTLVAANVISKLGPYTDSEHISLGLTDTLICVEMPFFAIAHMYAFSYRDFVKSSPSAKVHVARMRIGYAVRDAFGLKDLAEDTKATLRGEGINYRAFEPSEGGMHVGAARERRIRAGLRYSAGGKRKYWLPEVTGLGDGNAEGDRRGWFSQVTGNDGDAAAPLLAEHAENVVHSAPDMQYQEQRQTIRMPGDDVYVEDDDEYALHFNDDLATADDSLYEHAKNYVFGDYAYPVVDVSSEEARYAMWAAEERIVREGVHVNVHIGASGSRGYGATDTRAGQIRKYDDGKDELFASEERVVALEEGNQRAEVNASRKLRWSDARSNGAPFPSTSGSLSSSASGSGSGNHPRSSVSSSRHNSQTSHASRPRLLSGSNVNVRASSPYLHSSPSHSRSNLGTPSPRLLPSGLHSHPSPHPPLAEPDAVDLVVSTDTLPAPSSSHAAHTSLHARGLKRVWDQKGDIRVESSVGLEEESDRWSNDRRVVPGEVDKEHDIRKEEPNVPDGHVPEEVVRLETPPPHARAWIYGTKSPEEDEQNPWT